MNPPPFIDVGTTVPDPVPPRRPELPEKPEKRADDRRRIEEAAARFLGDNAVVMAELAK